VNCGTCTCGAGTKVLDSRDVGDERMRKRKCLGCGETFATLELPLERYTALQTRADTPLSVLRDALAEYIRVWKGWQ
jgi:transcriptional regulator NrdR family protein